MNIKEKIFMERPELEKEGPITIVAFGDSVTHGALARGEINYETVYWNLLRKNRHIGIKMQPIKRSSTVAC